MVGLRDILARASRATSGSDLVAPSRKKLTAANTERSSQRPCRFALASLSLLAFEASGPLNVAAVPLCPFKISGNAASWRPSRRWHSHRIDEAGSTMQHQFAKQLLIAAVPLCQFNITCQSVAQRPFTVSGSAASCRPRLIEVSGPQTCGDSPAGKWRPVRMGARGAQRIACGCGPSVAWAICCVF